MSILIGLWGKVSIGETLSWNLMGGEKIGTRVNKMNVAQLQLYRYLSIFLIHNSAFTLNYICASSVLGSSKMKSALNNSFTHIVGVNQYAGGASGAYLRG